MECNEYTQTVEKYLAEDSSAVFGNFSSAHAGYIISRFLETAKHSVEILSGSFADTFYDGLSIDRLLVETAIRVRRNGGQVRIITSDGITSERLRRLSQAANEIESNALQYASAEYRGSAPLKHFLVVDAKRYRLEEAHEKTTETPMCVKAEVCCNGRTKARELLEYFNRIWQVVSLQPTAVNAK